MLYSQINVLTGSEFVIIKNHCYRITTIIISYTKLNIKLFKTLFFFHQISAFGERQIAIYIVNYNLREF